MSVVCPSCKVAFRNVAAGHECESCGYMLPELHAALARAETAEGKVREAVRLAGEKLRGKDITDQEVNAVTDLILREEHCIGWMTTDEMEAAQADVQIRDDQIEDLTRHLAAALARAEKAEADSAKMLDEWETMYAGRECPKCRYHVTMNVSDDPPAMVAGRMKKVTAAARVDAVREFAEWAERDEVIVEDETHVEAAARFLARKEPVK